MRQLAEDHKQDLLFMQERQEESDAKITQLTRQLAEEQKKNSSHLTQIEEAAIEKKQGLSSCQLLFLWPFSFRVDILFSFVCMQNQVKQK